MTKLNDDLAAIVIKLDNKVEALRSFFSKKEKKLRKQEEKIHKKMAKLQAKKEKAIHKKMAKLKKSQEDLAAAQKAA